MIKRILIVIVLLAAVAVVWANIMAGKPRKLTPAEQRDSIGRKKPIGRG